MKNLFRAEFRETRTLVSSLVIELGVAPPKVCGYMAIRPEDIVLSREAVSSSMRNSFAGSVSAVIDQGF
jgi:hypothetical protein